MKSFIVGAGLLVFAALIAPQSKAEEVSEAVQAKIAHWTDEARQWAADPGIVKAVRAQNAQLSPGYAEMTQEKWETLTDADAMVRALTKNPAAQILRDKRTGEVSEAFLSDANGLKVAFLAKTTNWSHKGKPKHDVPISGKVWQGKLELDKSTGTRQIQIAVPVLDDGKPIGSLVLGISISALVGG